MKLHFHQFTAADGNHPAICIYAVVNHMFKVTRQVAPRLMFSRFSQQFRGADQQCMQAQLILNRVKKWAWRQNYPTKIREI